MEMKRLGWEEQVLLIGCSAAPQMCVKKDEKAFMGFFGKHIYLPLPRCASRLMRLVSCFIPAFVFLAVALDHAACLCLPVLL